MARRCSTICLPIGKDAYLDLVADPARFRAWLDAAFRDCPELFPQAFAQGYRIKDGRVSAKTGVRIRRIRLKATGGSFSVPFWAIARVFGRDHDYWYRLEVSRGRNSVAGATVRKAGLPEHLLADE